MARNKLEKFNYINESKNVYQPLLDGEIQIAGKWNDKFFTNANKIILELGCGKGEYSVGLAQKNPDKNFIGVDIKGNRIYHGAKQAIDENIENVAFLRTQILLINDFFEPGEVEEVWITFPDPRLRDRDEGRRLISPRFIELYKQFLLPGSIINLKTDNFALYQYSLGLVRGMGFEVLANTSDLYTSSFLPLCFDLQTTYEKKYLAQGVKINYLKFRI